MWITARGMPAYILACAMCTMLSACIIHDPPQVNSGSTSTDVHINNMSGGVELQECASNGLTELICLIDGVTASADVDSTLVDGTIFDPLILELPTTVTQVQGMLSTFANGAVVQVPLQVTMGLASIPVDAHTTLSAEPGMQLVIVDIPPGTALIHYSLSFSYSPPSPTLKALFAAKVKAGGTTYYPPLLPCANDFSAVPSISTSSSLSLAQVASLLARVPACTHKVYDFSGGAGAAPVDVIEFYNAGLDHYFITWVTNEIHDLDTGVHKGWARTGKSFRTYNTSQPGTSPVCRFYIPPALGDSHFFGRGTTECNETAQKFPLLILEDPMFMFMYLPSNGSCPPNTTEVHRAFDNRPDANHRYTTDPAVLAQMQALGWVAEGDGPDLVVMCAPL